MSYRTGKFVLRHKAGVAAGAAVAVSLFAGAALATVQARRAERRFNQVRRLANSVLYDFHDAIKDLPGSTRARETLVNTGLEYLDSLARDAGGDRSLQMDLAAAYQRVGDVQGRSTGASLGNTAAALASYRKGLAMAEEAHRLGEASESIQTRLIELHNSIANLQWQMNEREEALASFGRAVAIGESVAVPGRELLRHLASAYHDLARIQNDTTQALATSKKHLGIVERLAAADPASPDLRRELSDGYSNTGVMLERRSDLANALEHYRKAVELRQKLAGEDPNNTRIQRELMIGYGHLGDVLGNPQRLNLGDRAGAAQNYREAMGIAESLRKADSGQQAGAERPGDRDGQARRRARRSAGGGGVDEPVPAVERDPGVARRGRPAEQAAGDFDRQQPRADCGLSAEGRPGAGSVQPSTAWQSSSRGGGMRAISARGGNCAKTISRRPRCWRRRAIGGARRKRWSGRWSTRKRSRRPTPRTWSPRRRVRGRTSTPGLST